MRLRLIASFLILVLVTIGVFMFISLRQSAREVRNFILRGGLTGSEQVVAALEGYYGRHQTWEGVDEILHGTPRVPQGILLGQQMGRNESQRSNLEISQTGLLLTDAGGRLMASSGESRLNRGVRLPQADLRRAVPLNVDGETVGYLLVEGGQRYTLANQISLLSRLNRAAMIAVLISGGVAVILALVLSYSLVKPVQALKRAANQLATGDLSQRVQVNGNDEFAALGRTFNHMAESLQRAEESRRAMTADIAHELRTPLAVQRAHLEAIEDGVYPLTQGSLTVIEEQNHLLNRLVEDLGMLALADAGKLELQCSQVNFSDLVRQVASRFEVQAAERGIAIRLSLVDCPFLEIDSQRIQQILHNLLSNALRFTPDNGQIHCRLSLQNSLVSGLDDRKIGLPAQPVSRYACLEVHDSGPGIPPQAFPYIFDRFYRADKSRARSEGGIGLGLSIARKLAQAHRGDLTAYNHSQGGAVFSLCLPI